jgi:hypothetical protein
MDVDQEEPFVVHVYGSPYTVVGGRVKIPVAGRSEPKLYSRNRPAGEPAKSALEMQKRIEENIVYMNLERVR